jgi:hypothetical protein
LFKRVMTCLPYKLRDHIFAFIWDENYTRRYRNDMVRVTNKAPRTGAVRVWPHVIDLVYGGRQVVREMVETYYKMKTIGGCYLLYTDKPSDVRRYLYKNVLKSKTNPVEHA